MWITISSPGQEARTVELLPGRHTFGREPDNTVSIDDDRVSKHHAVVDVDIDGVWVTDLRSTNGTFVNGDRLMGAPVWAPAGTDLAIGIATIRIGTAGSNGVASEHAGVASGTAPLPVAGFAAPDTAPPRPATTGQLASLAVQDSGPVAGGNVSMSGQQVAGRDIVHEGFKIRSRMRRSAKNCIRLGLVLMLVGTAMFGYFVITWNSRIFDVIDDMSAEPPDDLPSPLPWLPLGAGLGFLGLVLIVVGLLVPRDREYTPRD